MFVGEPSFFFFFFHDGECSSMDGSYRHGHERYGYLFFTISIC